MGSALDKLKNHPIMLHNQAIKDICNPLNALNITTFSHVRVNNEQFFSCLVTDPAFAENYMKKQHYNADVHADKNHCHLLNCLMWDNIEAKGSTAQMLQDAADFQFNSIFTIIQKQENQVDYYHFGTHLKNRAMNQLYVNQFDLLEKFIQHFNESVKRVPQIAAAYDIAIELQQKPFIFTEQDRVLFETLIAQREKFLNRLSVHELSMRIKAHPDSYKLPYFTPGELKTIPMLLEGYTAKEIAKIQGVSYRTVEEYVSLLKKKLQARNKSDLITKLWLFYQSLLKSFPIE